MYDYYLGKPKRLDLLFAEMGKGVACSYGGIFRGENFAFEFGVALRSAIGAAMTYDIMIMSRVQPAG